MLGDRSLYKNYQIRVEKNMIILDKSDFLI